MTTTNISTVLVTGVSGYIGHHCAAELLKKGYNVRGTVRSLSKVPTITAGLAKVSDKAQSIEFFEADLLDDAGWEEALSGCDFLLHVASPFIMGEPDSPDDLIKPAVEGTKRALNFAKAAGVKRVVLTSSTVAAMADKVSGVCGPSDWADPDKVGSYAKSKILAEKAAWEFFNAQQDADKMELVSINPGGVMGPTLTGTLTGQSVTMIKDMIEGKVPMIPDIAVGMVDVREVAEVHVAALSVANVSGKRFLLSSEAPVPMMNVAKILKSSGYEKVSTRKAPKFLLWMMSWIDKDVKGMLGFVGKKVACDNTSTKEVFGWQPMPFEKTLLDMAKSIQE
jgi:dihydroflavonol-4-reductase